MITSRFFLENKEVIGLWVIYAIVMWLAVCVLDLIFDFIKKSKRKKIASIILKKEKDKEENYINQIRNENRFHKQFTNYVIPFGI